SPSGLPGLANRRAVMNICSCLRILESYLPRSPRPCLERMPATRGMRAIGQCPQCGMNQIRVERFLPLSDRREQMDLTPPGEDAAWDQQRLLGYIGLSSGLLRLDLPALQ